MLPARGTPDKCRARSPRIWAAIKSLMKQRRQWNRGGLTRPRSPHRPSTAELSRWLTGAKTICDRKLAGSGGIDHDIVLKHQTGDRERARSSFSAKYPKTMPGRPHHHLNADRRDRKFHNTSAKPSGTSLSSGSASWAITTIAKNTAAPKAWQSISILLGEPLSELDCNNHRRNRDSDHRNNRLVRPIVSGNPTDGGLARYFRLGTR